MKFTIEKNIILEGLNNVIRAISTKNVIPVLNGIKFELTSSGLYLTASDSELTIKVLIESKDIKQVTTLGGIIIQSKYILDIVRKMPSDIINFEVIDGVKIKIFTDNNQYNLNCLDINDYPDVVLEESKEPITIKGDLFKTIINQTVFAISNQETRPILTGINLKFTKDVLETVATDSYRLAKKNIKLSSPVEKDIEIIIPGKSISELERIITDEEDIEMHIFNNKVLFKYKNIHFQTNLLSGTYPNTSNLIPSEFAYIVKVNKREFNDAIDRAALLTQGKDKNIVKMSLDNTKMVINSFASEIGKVEEQLTVETNNREKLEISFSSKYMLEAIKTMQEEEILLLLNSDVKPIIIKSLTDESLIQLILPIKTY
ncbi:MAG: DNA polymerase III subunit beta [Bacilli bacterium]|nr:DNA polymerase III subunit beta [Bacilli bacterium]